MVPTLVDNSKFFCVLVNKYYLCSYNSVTSLQVCSEIVIKNYKDLSRVNSSGEECLTQY